MWYLVTALGGIIGGLGFSKWIESKQMNPVLTFGSELLFCYVLVKLLKK